MLVILIAVAAASLAAALEIWCALARASRLDDAQRFPPKKNSKK